MDYYTAAESAHESGDTIRMLEEFFQEFRDGLDELNLEHVPLIISLVAAFSVLLWITEKSDK